SQVRVLSLLLSCKIKRLRADDAPGFRGRFSFKKMLRIGWVSETTLYCRSTKLGDQEMPRLANGELSHHPTKGYRVSVGTYLKDGKPTPKVFWLGHDSEICTLQGTLLPQGLGTA